MEQWQRRKIWLWGQHFQGRMEILDIEHERRSALLRGDAKNKHLFACFAHLQFQTGLQSKLLFLQPATYTETLGPTLPTGALCLLSSNCFSPSSRTPGPDQLPQHIPAAMALRPWSAQFILKVWPWVPTTASILFFIPLSHNHFFWFWSSLNLHLF